MMQNNRGGKIGKVANGVFVAAVMLVAAMLVMAGHAQARTRTWIGAVSTDWNTDSNWSPKGIPGSADTAIIGQGKTVNVPKSVTVKSLTIDEQSTVQGDGDITVTSDATATDATFDGVGALSIPKGCVFNLKHNNNSFHFNLKRKVLNAGILNIDHPYLNFLAGLQNDASGIIDLKTDALFTAFGSSTPMFTNAGTLCKSAGTGVSTIGFACTNTGTIEAKSGTLSFGSFKQTAGTTNLNGGNISVFGTMTLDGGTLSGTGTINGNVVNNASLKPGHSPGATTINGNYTQSSSGSLDMEIGGFNPGSGYDQLVVNGSATLAGALNLISYNGYVPGENETFQLIKYYSSAGNFSTINGKYPGNQRWYFTVLGPTDYTATSHIDSIAPSLAVIAPLKDQSYASVTTATGTASDTPTTGSGLASVSVVLYRYAAGSTAAGYWNGGTAWTTTYSASNERVPTGTTSWSLSLPNLADGQYWVRATAKDMAGNSVTTANSNFWIGTSGLEQSLVDGGGDIVAPTVAVATPLNNKGYTSLTTATGTASDSSGSGLASVSVVLYRYAAGNKAAGYWNGGTSWTTTYSASNERVPTGTTSWSLTLPNLAAGQYWVCATSKDTAGNSTNTANCNFWIDSVVPASVAVTSPAASAFVSNLNTVSGTATDNSGGSGIDRVDLLIKRGSNNQYWTGTAWSATSTPLSAIVNGTTWTRNASMPTGTNLISGSYTLTATAYDKTGNSKAASITCTVDIIAPTINVTAPVANTVYTALSSATGTSADTGGSALNNVKIALYRYGNATTAASYWGGSSTWTTTYTAAANERVATGTTSWSLTMPTLAYGQYSLRATSWDKSGNYTSSPDIIFWKSAGTSTVALSTALATSSSKTVSLTFTGALDSKIATDLLRYTVTVNGVAVAVQSATYNSSTNGVTLTLPTGAILQGSTVVASWNKLFDTGGKVLSGQSSNLIAQ